jgi:LmbE family N-acetylglucosaminyl deacetylase
MLRLQLGESEPGLDQVLFVGAHSDDIEIGCGGTAVSLLARARPKAVTWVVLSADGKRETEARASAESVLREVPDCGISVERFRDGHFPTQIDALKEYFEALKARVNPSLIFTHHRGDLHQDHRLVADLVWQTFRNHTILEYEVPKYDGDLGAPNVFVHLDEQTCGLKIDNLLDKFPSQHHRRWFSRELFMALMRLRGMESNAPDGYAEAFYAKKLVLG